MFVVPFEIGESRVSPSIPDFGQQVVGAEVLV